MSLQLEAQVMLRPHGIACKGGDTCDVQFRSVKKLNLEVNDAVARMEDSLPLLKRLEHDREYEELEEQTRSATPLFMHICVCASLFP